MMTEEAGRVATADGATIAWTRRGPTAGADAPWLLFCPGLGMTQKGYAADAAWFAARAAYAHSGLAWLRPIVAATGAL